MYRSHTCGELRATNEGQEVTLAGWVQSIRTHGAVTFIDIRDRYGITQVTSNKPIDASKESVIQVKGTVVKKPEANKKLETGEIEVQAKEVILLNRSAPLPLDENATEETRLKYRYLDLRSSHMQKNLILRHKATMSVRKYFDELGFLEMETPILGKSTPEGARDYLVPSRVNQGKFYALPQSPQIFKQLFQVGGLDRYLQIVKCFRDEDLRADRQPEFTQIDLEMSYVQEEDIYSVMEGMIARVWKETIGVELSIPFARMKYDEAMLRFGSDKPDVRFGLEIEEVTKWAKATDFSIFKEAEVVRCLKVAGDFSRKQIDKLTDIAKVYGAKGLAWVKKEEGNLAGGIAKFLKDVPVELKDNEYLFFVADSIHVVPAALGAVRLHLGKELQLIKEKWSFLWITDFPLMEWSEEDSRYVAMHHPFTSPQEEDRHLLATEPHHAKSKAYDLTLNGVELGGGSIRIHQRDLQVEVFNALGITEQEQKEKFGFLLGAFEYGAPPHGGLAFGLDRMVMLLAGAENIREVIAFPKNKDAVDLMMDSPSSVSQAQLDELAISTRKK
ncbi:MAG: aspartate--tRNA ligase [Nanoarchaeota archaeon]|nr:aspartate--tRNA ligase [Nanoarchaeota archaeon]